MERQAHHSASPGMAHRHPRTPGHAVGEGIAAAGLVSMLLAACGTTPASDDPLRLSVPDTGTSTASCLPVTTEYLAEMSPAFAGTVTDVGDDTVTLHVDRWYAGNGPEEVLLTIPPGAVTSLIGEIDFREGVTYLITATDGTVNLCGFSGEATTELQAAYDAAF